ncbi:MAG: sporulation transcriptional regulator SpoIIID [Christensenellales bacterium]
MTTNYANLQNIAKYYLSQHTNIRKTAQHFGLSKSTVHNCLHKLKFVDLPLYRQVEIQAKINFDNKHIYGGIATRKKYKKISKIH